MSVPVEPELAVSPGGCSIAQFGDCEQERLHGASNPRTKPTTFVCEVHQALTRDVDLPVRTDAFKQSEVLLLPAKSRLHVVPPLLDPSDNDTAFPQLDTNSHCQLFGLVPGNIVNTEPSGLRITV